MTMISFLNPGEHFDFDHGAPKTQTHDLLILKIITWVRGSEPQKSFPLQRFSALPNHSTYKELGDMAQSRRFWRSLVVAIEPEDTLELQKRKKAREERSSGTTSLDLDASQWLKGVNKQGKFDGGLIAK